MDYPSKLKLFVICDHRSRKKYVRNGIRRSLVSAKNADYSYFRKAIIIYWFGAKHNLVFHLARTYLLYDWTTSKPYLCKWTWWWRSLNVTKVLQMPSLTSTISRKTLTEIEHLQSSPRHHHFWFYTSSIIKKKKERKSHVVFVTHALSLIPHQRRNPKWDDLKGTENDWWIF